MNSVLKNYETYDEEGRLSRDHAHRLEFITTVEILKEYLAKESLVLDVAAGTGQYAFYLTEQGYGVTACDLVPKHVDTMKSKAAEKAVDIPIFQGDARDLSRFSDQSFDAVLCMGPLYHLENDEEKSRCLRECLRVLKKGGILAAAYINKFAACIYMTQNNPGFIEDKGFGNLLNTGRELGDERDCFFFTTPDEIDTLMNGFPVRKLTHAATDGIAYILCDMVNPMTQLQFDRWVDYHLQTCRESSLLGYSMHGLYVCRKME